MITRTLFEGLALGASTSMVCFGTCAPFVVPLVMMDGKSGLQKNIRTLLEFLAGRLIAYVLFGIFFGWLGAVLRPHLSAGFRTGTLLVTSGLMIFFALTRSFPKNPVCKSKGAASLAASSPFLFGFLLGLNLCPPFMLGMARLLEIGTPMLGGIFFAAFFFSSSLYLVPVFLLLPMAGNDRMKHLGCMTAVMTGTYFLAKALTGF